MTMGFPVVNTIGFIKVDNSVKDGVVGQVLNTTEESGLTSGMEKSLIFNGFNKYWNIYGSNEIDNRITILVMDDGLSVDQWLYLESNSLGVTVDIIKYIYYDSGLNIFSDTGGSGIDSASNIGAIIDSDQETYHGSAVVSAIAQIARNVNIIFVSIGSESDKQVDMSDSTFQGKGKTNLMWGKINSEVVGGVDIINLSWGFSNLTPFELEDSENNPTNYDLMITNNPELILITSAGNDGGNYVDDTAVNPYPAILQEWWAVGSIDHETYDANGNEDFGDDYFSEEIGKDQLIGSDAVIYRNSLFTVFGNTLKDQADSIDFVMPGNGIPIYSYDQFVSGSPDLWYYGSGTSFSSPYLAAATAIAMDAFYDGITYYESFGIAEVIPEPSKRYIREILIEAGMYDYTDEGFNVVKGYGYVDIKDAYSMGFAYPLASGIDGRYLAGITVFNFNLASDYFDVQLDWGAYLNRGIHPDGYQLSIDFYYSSDSDNVFTEGSVVDTYLYNQYEDILDGPKFLESGRNYKYLNFYPSEEGYYGYVASISYFVEGIAYSSTYVMSIVEYYSPPPPPSGGGGGCLTICLLSGNI